MSFKKAAAWLAVHTITPVWSFIVNVVFWLFNLNHIKKALSEKKWLKKNVLTLNDVKREMGMFTWKKDSYGDWIPWIITIIHNNRFDDCDGAAALGKFLLDNIGMDGKILHLRGNGKVGHAVVVSKDRSVLISNSDVVKLNPISWEAGMYGLFKNKYSWYV